jgi:hypothetical protein
MRGGCVSNIVWLVSQEEILEESIGRGLMYEGVHHVSRGNPRR